MELKVVQGIPVLHALPGQVHELTWAAAARREPLSLGSRTARALRLATDALVAARQGDDVAERVVDAWAAFEATSSLTAQAAAVHDELDRLRNGETPADMDPPRAVLEARTGVLEAASRLWAAGRAGDVLRSTVGRLHAETRASVTASIPEFDLLVMGQPATDVRAMGAAMTGDVFLAELEAWTSELRQVASRWPGSGACTIASAIELWLFTLKQLERDGPRDAEAVRPLDRMGVKSAMADALAWLLAVRAQVLDFAGLARVRPRDEDLAAEWPDIILVLADVCHAHAAKAAGEAGRISAELVYGYRRHPAWDADGYAGCFQADDLETLEEYMPGFASCARAYGEVIETDGSHRPKAGPCARFDGVETFVRLRTRLDGCLTGARLARDRAAAAVEALAERHS